MTGHHLYPPLFYLHVNILTVLSLATRRPPLAVNVARRLVRCWWQQVHEVDTRRSRLLDNGRGRRAQPILCYAISSSNERYFFDSPIRRWKRSVSTRQFDETPRFLWISCRIWIVTLSLNDSLLSESNFFFRDENLVSYETPKFRSREFDKFNLVSVISRIFIRRFCSIDIKFILSDNVTRL